MRASPREDGTVLDAEATTALGRVQLVRFDAPTDLHVRPPSHMLELCIVPRPESASGGYPERWGPHRREPLGDIVFVPAGEALHVRCPAAAQQSAIVCLFSGNEIVEWLGNKDRWTDPLLSALLDISSITIRQLLRRLAAEVHNPGAGGDRLIGFLVGQLVIELGRYCEAVGDRPISGGLAPWRLRLIDRRLHDAVAPPRLRELAEVCGLSVRQLTRGFRASRGCSIADCIAHHRMEAAKRLLAGDAPIKTVASETGYASPASFAKAFQQAIGVAPGQFRQRVLKAGIEAGRGTLR